MAERERADIARIRLYNQGITNPLASRPADVVARLGAVQAQDYAGAKWGVGLRMQSATDDIVEQACNEGAILRTHLLRPTWHFVTPADIRWMLALTAPRVHVANAHIYRKLELDQVTVKKSNAALTRALQGGQYLTREELKDALQRAGIATDAAFRVTYLMMHAELDGILCSGPRRGKQFTYALLEERVPPTAALELDDALAELARRYFTSRGPATVHDFAKWSGLTVTAARQALDSIDRELRHETIHGTTCWFSPSTLPASDDSRAHLLSIYDEYISSYRDRSAMVTNEVSPELRAMGNALTYIIVVDGQVVGSWKRTLYRDAVVVETNPFLRLEKDQERAIAEAAHQYGEFLGLNVRLTRT